METAAPLALAETVHRASRVHLLTCRVPPAGELKISNLCTNHASSLGTVRETLSRLTSEGLRVCLPQRGFQAAGIATAESKDLTLARVEIEALCLGMTVQRGDLAWEERLLGTSHRLARTEKRVPDGAARRGDAWVLAHGACHEALVAACSSPALLQIRRQLYALSERCRPMSVPLAETERDVDQEHRDLVAAALDRDVIRARDQVQARIERTGKILLHALDDRIEFVAKQQTAGRARRRPAGPPLRSWPRRLVRMGRPGPAGPGCEWRFTSGRLAACYATGRVSLVERVTSGDDQE